MHLPGIGEEKPVLNLHGFVDFTVNNNEFFSHIVIVILGPMVVLQE